MSQPTCLILTGREDALNNDETKPLLASNFSGLLDCTAEVAHFSEVEFVIGESVRLSLAGRELTSYQQIVFYSSIKKALRLAYPLAKALQASGTPVLTGDSELYWGVDKLSQYVELSLMRAPIPLTYFAATDTLIQNAGKVIGFPMVVKDIISSKGERNFLIHTQADLAAMRSELTKDRYVAQEYIKNDHDIRVLLNSNGDWFAFSRHATTGHKNNTSQGGQAKKLAELPVGVLDTCKRVLTTTKRTYAGFDVMLRPNGSFVILEINSGPQIFTGAFVNEKAAWFKKTINLRIN